MDARIGPALGGVALLLVGWNTYTLTQLDGRLSVMELTTAPAPGGAVVAERGGEQSGSSAMRPMRQRQEEVTDLSSQAVADILEKQGLAMDGLDFEDPDVRARIAQIVEEDQEARQAEESERRMEQYMDSVTREVQDFAAEEGLDGKTTEKLLEELRIRSENWNAVRKDVGEGKLSWFDARKEFQALREESDSVMNTLLGEEVFTVLDTRLWGDHGRGH